MSLRFRQEHIKELRELTWWAVEEVTKYPFSRTTGWWNFIFKENAEAFAKEMNSRVKGLPKGEYMEYRVIPDGFNDDIWKDTRQKLCGEEEE